jgi:diguanylate cyclase (GGDEF)-like protein/PAS domain S-box-containing protein
MTLTANTTMSKTMESKIEGNDELRISEVVFETNEAIMITDADDNIIRVNRAFSEITGYSSAEVAGMSSSILNSGCHSLEFYNQMRRQLLDTGSWAGEVLDKRKNGEIYTKSTKVTAVRNEQQHITHYVCIFNDLSERKKNQEKIRNLAFYDSLTKLPNRHLFLDRLSAALSTTTRLTSFGAILLIDLDRFKLFNDTLGHFCGDLLLIEVAARIKSSVSEMDTVARLGADEFIVLIEDVSDNPEGASSRIGLLAEKIRDSLARPFYCNGHQIISSPSIGVSLFRGNEKSVDTLVQQADMAMYQAKTAGRNTIRFFDPVMQNKVAEHAALESDLRHAIPRQQLYLHYQMQVDNNHRPTGAEALLRWIHPERGEVLPGTFIPLAEESNLILEIGNWVFDNACRQLALWADGKQTKGLVLAVNVSAKQFAIPDFVNQVADVLNKYRVDPSRLKLELTESVMLENMADTIEKMHALKRLGVTLAMDDFGIGYSSLSYLKQLPLDQLKIDQGFVQGITMGGSDAMLVQTIIDLATNFRLNVIAEGVESQAQLAFLKHHDCMAFQGYLFGKALPVKEFERALHRIINDLTGSFRIFKPSLHHA